jgi:cbb3-type cytochrome c oxidase subunit III
MKNQTFMAILVLATLACGCTSTKPLALQQASLPKDQVDARGLYRENCATCHGEDGRGKTFHGWLVGAQNFTAANWQTDTTDAEIVKAIKTGPWVMPAFEKKLSAAEIAALADYVRTFKPTS